MRRARTTALWIVLAVLAAACGGGGAGGAGAGPTDDPDAATDLAVAVASFDVAVGDGQRLMAGLFSPQRELLAFGSVTFELGFLGDEPTGSAASTETVRADFLPVPGMEPDGTSPTPRFITDSPGSGVYAATVDLDRPGFWALRVSAELEDGAVLTGTTSFRVLEVPEVPAVGAQAPRTANLTIADIEAGAAEPVALDSRAQRPDDPLPDPHLHEHTIAEALEAERPVVAVFSTPVYCQSRFCGPLVNIVSELALRHDDRAEFVMVEVWEDFDEMRLNDAAAEWIQTETGGNEPWVFLIDGDGTILARWDNVLNVSELERKLAALPETAPLP